MNMGFIAIYTARDEMLLTFHIDEVAGDMERWCLSNFKQILRNLRLKIF